MSDRNDTTLLTPNTTQGLRNGICYFKLPEEYFLQEGDETKECGLLGTDMDSNFHFLEGYDISAVTYDAETKILELIRVDGSKIFTTVEITLGNPTIEYDPEKGVLSLVYPDGASASTSGFLTKDDILPTYTDQTIDGEGTEINPFGLSELEKTGMFAPVQEYVDIYETGKIPERFQKGEGYRILTREKASDFGELYDYGVVMYLQNALSGTSWRIPTEADWEELFDAINADEEWAGKEGTVLKSVDYWKVGAGIDSLGFRALPTGFDSNPYTDIVENFGEATGFWSYNSASTSEAEVYFIFSGEGKTSFTEPVVNHHYAIRLIKDYTPDSVEEYETILGTVLPTKLIKLCDSYARVWTVANFYSWDDNIRGISSPEISGASTVGYFINEWNGTGWDKKRLQEGESVVIIAKEHSAPYREWRLQDGELVDVLKELYTSAANLTHRVFELERKVEYLMASATTENDVMEIVKRMIIGTDREIKVTTTDENVQIGFADDSIFGETDLI